MISSAQIRAGRAMLGMTQSTLAERAGVSRKSLVAVEMGTGDPRASTLAAIEAVLKAAGVVFIEANGDGPGVRLRKASTK